MKKSTLSILVAGLVAVGGIAQAETFVTTSPSGDGTVWVDTTVLGAAPATVMLPSDHYVYVQPGWSGSYDQRTQAAATFNVPARAGEASTMTGGQPNVSTDNQRIAGNTYVPVWSVPSY